MATALVTGGNRGLGFEVARSLAREGMHVLVGARDAQSGERAAAQIRSEGYEATPVVLDVTSSDSIAAAAARIAEAGRLDVLVNNAGILPEARGASSPDFADPAVAEETFRTNVIGAIAVTRRCSRCCGAAPPAGS